MKLTQPSPSTLSGFLSDSWIPIFVKLKGTLYFVIAAALSNQGEIMQQIHMSWSGPQTHTDCVKSIKNCTHRSSMDVRAVVTKQLTE